jgi:hypothetical protein
MRAGADEGPIVSELLQRISCVALEREGYMTRSWTNSQRLSVNANDADILFNLAVRTENKVSPEQPNFFVLDHNAGN